MLSPRVCKQFHCATGAYRVGLRDSVGVELMTGVSVKACVQSAIGCGCKPLEMGKCTLGVCTSVVAGEIGSGMGIRGMGWALGRDALLTLVLDI